MIDEIFELLLDAVVELIPNSVWKALAFIFGVAMTAVGVIMVTESPWTGGVLIAVGLSLLVGSVISWYREG